MAPVPQGALGDVQVFGDVAPQPAEVEQVPAHVGGAAPNDLFVVALLALLGRALALGRAGGRHGDRRLM